MYVIDAFMQPPVFVWGKQRPFMFGSQYTSFVLSFVSVVQHFDVWISSLKNILYLAETCASRSISLHIFLQVIFMYLCVIPSIHKFSFN